ncbi:SigE family RNA polymerase sigma factor [Streptomyces sp. NBC_01435]|uniref:SigE family RNA polymerase sigma factor n=1 Tax=Streptomyces sp. NBC_01435 TaxID=2903865 RepID=UPI002E2F1B14|nr:SigE family RNA polymerase sigma factor [Streptomyces sp. NBC_01435]
MTTPVCTGSSGGAAATGHPPYPAHLSHTLHGPGHGAHSQHGPQGTYAPRTTRTPRTPYAPYPSFSSFVRARGPVLLRAARSLTANPSDAEDLLQTALTKTYVAWERIEDHRALDGYVRRALLNTRTSQWRKRKVDEFACDELPEQEAVPGPDPAEQQSLHDAMWRAVLKLPDRQRAMVVLRYYEDLSEAQTAEVLGVSVGTVKSAVSRALGKLREDPELAPVR